MNISKTVNFAAKRRSEAGKAASGHSTKSCSNASLTVSCLLGRKFGSLNGCCDSKIDSSQGRSHASSASASRHGKFWKKVKAQSIAIIHAMVLSYQYKAHLYMSRFRYLIRDSFLSHNISEALSSINCRLRINPSFRATYRMSIIAIWYKEQS